MGNRRNERPKTWFRSDRFFRSNEQWYFHTREGCAIGPYRTRFDAEVDAGRLLAILRNTPDEHAMRVIRDFGMGAGCEFDYVNDPAFTNYLTQEGKGALAKAR